MTQETPNTEAVLSIEISVPEPGRRPMIGDDCDSLSETEDECLAAHERCDL